ncbi:MAG: hypothetical protein AAGD25_40600 [Cyanobacteria bacterium P01_F01_bin.150]
MLLPGFPDVTTVENLFLWAAVALDNKKYPAVQLNDSIAATSPISIRTGRVTASSAFNDAYVRITADLPLDSGKVNIFPLYQSSLELVAGDILPSELSDGLTSGGDSDSGEPSLYSLPFADSDYLFWFVGEKMSSPVWGSLQWTDHVDSQRIAQDVSSDNYVAVMNSHPGYLFPNYNSTDFLVAEQTLHSFSFIVCIALESSTDYVYCYTANSSDYSNISIGRSLEIYDHPSFPSESNSISVDDTLHVFHVCLDGTSVDFYLDGSLVWSVNSTSAISPITFEKILNNAGGAFFLTDYILINRKITADEIAQSYAAIATYRGMI